MVDNTVVDNTAYDRRNVDLDDDESVLGDSQHQTEPATTHDVGEGAGIGAVGGAVVGALAGGPLGAVIGAVVGGAASAAAVDVVDKHDHDYNRTVAGSNADYSNADYTNGDYRDLHQARYGDTGPAYEEHHGAYAYGNALANDPRYQNSDWDTVQTGARSDWDSRNEGTWDRVKDSVRYSWDRAKGHTADTGSADDTIVYTNTGPRANV